MPVLALIFSGDQSSNFEKMSPLVRTASGRYEAVARRIARGADELSLGNTALWQFPCLVAVHWISYKGWFAGPWRRAPHWLCYTLWGAGVALALQWAAKDFRPFVYFQF